MPNKTKTINQPKPVVKNTVLVNPSVDLIRELRDLKPSITKAESYVITEVHTEEEMGRASENKAFVRKIRQAWEDKWDTLKKPLNEVLRLISDEFKPVVERFKAMEKVNTDAIGTYHRMAEVDAQAKQAELDRLHRAQQKEAREHGQNPLAVPAPQPVVAPPTGFQTQHGGVHKRRLPKWKVTELEKVPYNHLGSDLWMLNEIALTKLRHQAGEDLSRAPEGIEYYYEETWY